MIQTKHTDVSDALYCSMFILSDDFYMFAFFLVNCKATKILNTIGRSDLV